MQTITMNNTVDINIKLLNISAFLTGMLFCLPVIVLYYQDEMNLTFQDFLIGESLFALTVVCMEVPTGWIADTWGRRNAVLLGCFFAICGFTMLFLAKSFIPAVTGQMLLGMAVALKSGSTSALLYDTLLSAGRENEFQKREGLRHGMGLYGTGLSSAIGGFLYSINHMVPIALDAVLAAINFLVFLMIKEPQRHKYTAKHNALADMMFTIRYAMHGHKDVARLIIMIAIVFSTTKAFIWAQQAFVKSLDINEGIYGLMLACAMLIAGSASHFGHTIIKALQGTKLLLCFLLFVATICIISGALNNGLSLVLLMTGSSLWGFGWPRVQDSINALVGSERRATILSTAALAPQLLFIPLSLLMGHWEQSHGIQDALIFHGCLLTIIAVAIGIFLKKYTAS